MSKINSSLVIIIDPVGIKAGINSYNNGLAKGMFVNSVKCIICSNYTEEAVSYTTHQVYNRDVKKKHLQLYDIVKGTFKACFIAKKNKVKTFIVHSFSFELKDLLFFIIVRMFSRNIINIIHDVNGFAEKDNNRIRKIISKKLSQKIVVQNNYTASLIQQQYPFLLSKMNIISMGNYLDIEHSNITKSTARQVLKIQENEQYILFFGQIKKQKGLEILIQALPFVDSKIKLIIAGRPWKNDFDHYQDLIDSLKLNNRIDLLVKFISDEDREFLIKAADVVVLPYKKIFNSAVLSMAMSFGTPVIATRLPAIAEVVTDGIDCLLFENEKVEDLASKINIFFNDFSNQDRNNISIKALDTMRQKYSWEAVAEKYKKII